MKRIQYPNGHIGFASDKAAAIIAKKPGHKIVNDKAKDEGKNEGGEKK